MRGIKAHPPQDTQHACSREEIRKGRSERNASTRAMGGKGEHGLLALLGNAALGGQDARQMAGRRLSAALLKVGAQAGRQVRIVVCRLAAPALGLANCTHLYPFNATDNRGWLSRGGLVEFDAARSARNKANGPLAGERPKVLFGGIRGSEAELGSNLDASRGALVERLEVLEKFKDFFLAWCQWPHPSRPLLALGGEFGPDQMPAPLAQHVTRQLLAGGLLNAYGLDRIHVPAAGQALVQVLLINPVRRSEFSAPGWCDLDVHERYSSASLRFGQAFSYTCDLASCYN